MNVQPTRSFIRKVERAFPFLLTCRSAINADLFLQILSEPKTESIAIELETTVVRTPPKLVVMTVGASIN